MHFTLGLRPCIFSSFLLKIYLPPPSQNYPVVPLYVSTAYISRKWDVESIELSAASVTMTNILMPPSIQQGTIGVQRGERRSRPPPLFEFLCTPLQGTACSIPLHDQLLSSRINNVLYCYMIRHVLLVMIQKINFLGMKRPLQITVPHSVTICMSNVH